MNYRSLSQRKDEDVKGVNWTSNFFKSGKVHLRGDQRIYIKFQRMPKRYENVIAL